DWAESAAGENFAAVGRSCRVAIHVTDRERGCPRGTLGDPAAVITDPFAGGQMIDAQDARFETIRWTQPAALHCGVGHVAAVDRESRSYRVEERLGVGALDCVGRRRMERVERDAFVTRRGLHLAQSRDLLAVEVGVLGELGKRSFYMYAACA